MWHMDTKAHSLSMWMHNLDTLANLDKSGVCNQANLDKADTPVDTIRSQKDNTNMQLQPSCAITTPTPCSSCPMGADVYSQSSCSRWKQIFYKVDTGLNQWMWILWILRIHLPQSPTTRTLSGIWDNTPLPGLDSYMDGTITQVHTTTSNRSCSPLKWKSVAPL